MNSTVYLVQTDCKRIQSVNTENSIGGYIKWMGGERRKKR